MTMHFHRTQLVASLVATFATGTAATVVNAQQSNTAPAASVAETVTVVLPIAKALPDAFEITGVIAPSRASIAVTVKFATAPEGLVASTSTGLAGSVSAGAVASTIQV